MTSRPLLQGSFEKRAKGIRWASGLALWACLAVGGWPLPAPAAEFYVTPTGTVANSGANWHTAFSNLQDAVNLATNGDDTIYLQRGVWSNAVALLISNAPGVTFRGGRNGLLGGGSNDYSGTNSTWTKTGGVMRIVSACDSVITMACVTVSGGLFTNGGNNGAGLFFTNCAATMTNCVVRDNTNACDGVAYGGGVCAVGGSLFLLDTAFYNNSLQGSTVQRYGGGVGVVNCPLAVRGNGSVFSNNAVSSGTPYGGAIYAADADLILDNVTLIGNRSAVISPLANSYGGAVYYTGGGNSATITGCWFEANVVSKSGNGLFAHGGAVFLNGGTGLVADCTFTNNSAIITGTGTGTKGGGLYATNMQSLRVVSSVFRNNRVGSTILAGGTMYITACSNTVVEGCALSAAGVSAETAPELVYVSGRGNTWILNSTVLSNNAGRGFTFAGGVNSSLTLSNCQVAGNNGNGVSFAGDAGSTLGLAHCEVLDNNGNGLAFTNGAATLFNCLLARNVRDGVSLAGGTVSVANCTLADNGGWGLGRTSGAGTVSNSIAWGNVFGGVMSNENVWVDFTCLPAPAYGGEGNFTNDPVFANVPGCYYLSSNGLYGQVASSPCIDAGSGMAASWGLGDRTTCTSGTNDAVIVDLGFHYTNGVPDDDIMTATNVYVDAVSGNDANGGAAWGTAWKRLTHALSNVAANATIHVATGTYSAANGEVFPLTVRMPGLTLAASNANPALTVVDNAGTNGQRVLQASGKGTLVLRGLTFRGGRFDSGWNHGAGLSFLGCAATLTNCVVRDNTNLCTTASYGGGLYAAGGSLALLDTACYNNLLQAVGVGGYGGGVAATNCPLIVRGSGSVFSNNVVAANAANPCGGAIYAAGADLTLAGAILIGNRSDVTATTHSYGGAVYHTGSGNSATITGCWFEANVVSKTGNGSFAHGGAAYLAGATGMIADCTFTNNSAILAASGTGTKGGGIYATNLHSLQVVASVFRNNRVGSTILNGGSLYLVACSNTVVDRCTIDAGGIPAATSPELVLVSVCGSAQLLNSKLRNNPAGRGAYFISSTASLTNCLVANNADAGILVSGGPLGLAYCTLAGNGGWGIGRPGSDALEVKNSIIWGNAGGGIGSSVNVTITYADSQDFWAPGLGAGNFSADPLFVDPAAGDYHLASRAGSWHDGAWTADAQVSPCLDAGDPASDWTAEPKPNRGRVNLGAFGNTPEASRSARGTIMTVQ